MSGFLRFTLFVAALCAAAVVGYVAGARNADRGALSDDRMTIDTGQSPGSVAVEPAAPMVAAKPETKAEDAAAEEVKPEGSGDDAAKDPGAPTSIDDILERQSSQTPAN